MHGQQNIKFNFLLPLFCVLLFVIGVFMVYLSAVFVFVLMAVVAGE